ncbi:YhjD/YihY/BrkB family envelope integrity protein [Stackebrandtia soli]|uniref:YihY/virulence factor BrkB family protein n=1 Tax=Stackebrandtia soli TaxID=1892856 RepID=UPI0039EC5228
MKFPDVGAAFDRLIAWLRARSKRFDHFWRAQERFFEVHAGLLSAAISYYAFFAALSLSLLSLSVLGYLLELPDLERVVQTWLNENLPIIDVNSIKVSRQTAGLIALGALTITGVSWVQGVRSSIRAVWLLEQEPGHPIWRWIVDLVVLFALGVLLISTLAITAAAEVALNWLRDGYAAGWLTTLISYGSTIVGIGVNTVLSAALLSALPRLALPIKRVLPPALWVAIGLELLKTMGNLYITSVSNRPAYQAVGTAVGLLIFLFLFNQMLMFAAAWTATSRRGNAIDLVERKRIRTERFHRAPSAITMAPPVPLPASSITRKDVRALPAEPEASRPTLPFTPDTRDSSTEPDDDSSSTEPDAEDSPSVGPDAGSSQDSSTKSNTVDSTPNSPEPPSDSTPEDPDDSPRDS